MYAAIAGAVVVAIVVALVIVKTTGSSNTSQATPASPDVVRAVTTIPASTFGAVGAGSGLQPPFAVKGQPLLMANGKPEVFYAGGEFCPYCAAERWAIVAGLSRFGTFSNLKQIQSSSTDVYPNTPTFSFYGSSYSSPYVAFNPIELFGDSQSTTLQTPTPEQKALLNKYDAPPFLPSTSNNGQSSAGGIPFLDYGNMFVSSGASYSPAILQGLSMGTIAGSLHDPSTTPAKNIVAQANVVSAMVCKMTGGNPGNVCSSAGVQKAEASLPAAK